MHLVNRFTPRACRNGEIPSAGRGQKVSVDYLFADDSNVFARDAYEFIEVIQDLASTHEIMDAMQPLVSRLGMQYFCFNYLSNDAQHIEDLAKRLPEDWVKLYVEQNLVQVDPSFRHCRRAVRPYRWFKESPYDPETEPRAAQVVQRARDFGLLDGLVIPIACPGGKVGHVWMGGRTLDIEECELPAVHLMALYAFDRVLRLQLPPGGEKAKLTTREREVMTWFARGKSSWEVGEILGIAKRTVEHHAYAIYKKVGAENRVQAIMIALRDQLIQL